MIIQLTQEILQVQQKVGEDKAQGNEEKTPDNIFDKLKAEIMLENEVVCFLDKELIDDTQRLASLLDQEKQQEEKLLEIH
ncbi:hypothetical protein H4Q26_015949, partial [Puccinia striiformis f. sp. tritici PST-130]